MRPMSLLVFARGLQTVPQELHGTFEAQLSERDESIDVKPHEASSVTSLVEAVVGAGTVRPHIFEGFVFSFRIPQISCEFDLLKITEDAVINIELKSEEVGLERIGEQLRRNRHYLSPIGLATHSFTYVSDTGDLFELAEGDDVGRVGIGRLAEVLNHAGSAYEGQVEDLFKVSNYLVSPLNDPDKFLGGRYFLTNHQAQIKASFLRACASEDSVPCYLVYGSAGTGKSLLLYDLARTRVGTHPSCVIHCGVLCEGHEVLDAGQDAFHVVSAKRSERVDLASFGALFVDEAQRLWPSQLRRIAEVAATAHLPLYLSLDRRQRLTRREDEVDVEGVVRSLIPETCVWELSRKIRTNRELVDFIRSLFGMSGGERARGTNHVKVASARGVSGARELVEAFRGEGYQYISLADEDDDLSITGCPNPYAVVGQEFDRVVMALPAGASLADRRMCQLLYQGLTRARDDIALVVYDNQDMLLELLRRIRP